MTANDAKSLIDAMKRKELLGWAGIWPDEIADRSVAGREHLIKRLKLVLCDLRQDGIMGHWSYSVRHHAAIVDLIKTEEAELAGMTGERELA